MNAFDIATIIIVALTILLSVGLFLLTRVIKNPVYDFYQMIVKKSQAKDHPIIAFRYIDILYTVIFEGAIFGVSLLIGLGYFPGVILCSLFLPYRLLFYRALLTSPVTRIFTTKRSSTGDKTFDLISFIFLIFMVALVVVPILNLVARAFSDGIYNSQITFVPVGFTFYSFEYVFNDAAFIKSFGNSILLTIVVTIFSNIFMALAGYALAKKDFPFRKGILFFFIVTMLYSSGVVPIYLLMDQMKLLNNIWAVILVSISNVFNLLLFKTAFEGLPSEVEESALVDGCSSFALFFRVALPMTLPTFASCCFFTIVGTWNGYGTALLFITETDAMPLALYLYTLLASTSSNVTDPVLLLNFQNIQAASIIVSTIPIIIIYPFIIKYIRSGITIGSVKG